MERDIWESFLKIGSQEVNLEEVEQELNTIENCLKEEQNSTLHQYLDSDGMEWLKSYQAKCGLLDRAKELLFFMKGWKTRGRMER